MRPRFKEPVQALAPAPAPALPPPVIPNGETPPDQQREARNAKFLQLSQYWLTVLGWSAKEASIYLQGVGQVARLEERLSPSAAWLALTASQQEEAAQTIEERGWLITTLKERTDAATALSFVNSFTDKPGQKVRAVLSSLDNVTVRLAADLLRDIIERNPLKDLTSAILATIPDF